MYVKATACGRCRTATDIDGHRERPEPANRPNRPLRPIGYPSNNFKTDT
jgi:hypothetical protein